MEQFCYVSLWMISDELDSIQSQISLSSGIQYHGNSATLVRRESVNVKGGQSVQGLVDNENFDFLVI